MEKQMKHLVMICLLVLGVTSGAEAEQNKIFVYHLSGRPDYLLDPVRCWSMRCQRAMWPIYESLGILSSDSTEVRPGLAESWQVSPDGLTYTLLLRKGVTFHDGTPFDAEAVKLSLERYFVPGGSFYAVEPSRRKPHTWEKSLRELIKKITVQDAHTLIVTLKHPGATLLFRVPLVSPTALAKDGEKYGKHPVGTGPFRFVRWNNDEIRYAANLDYWSGRPKLDQISYRMVPKKKKMPEFLSGKLDFILEVAEEYRERVIANPSTNLMRVSALNICYLGFQADRKPFQDPRVIKAITKAINIKRIIAFLSRGKASPARGIIPPGADGYEPDLKRPPYDPDEAQRLLQEAGYTSGLQFSLLYNHKSNFFGQLAQAVKADLSRTGIAVELKGMRGWTKLAASIFDAAGDAYLICRHFDTPHPGHSIARMFDLSHYKNAKIENLLAQAERSRDPSERFALYLKAHRVILEEAPIIPLYHKIRIAGVNTRVTGLELNLLVLPTDRFLGVDVREE